MIDVSCWRVLRGKLDWGNYWEAFKRLFKFAQNLIDGVMRNSILIKKDACAALDQPEKMQKYQLILDHSGYKWRVLFLSAVAITESLGRGTESDKLG